ncbi:MAG: asparagine synthetase B, partial [Bacteroidota bacterium]|nr:asparagine synthetase B [Bacteroidota bacterium]
MQRQPLHILPRLIKFLSVFLLITVQLQGATILIPMDEDQNDHLKAYGITYWALAQGYTGDWLLNYRGGSFAFPDNQSLQLECRIRGVDFEVVSTASYDNILREIASPSVNAEKVKLEKAPRVAVYSPKSKKPWDDAVTLVLTYAEIPYDVLYDDEILDERLLLYDWLHLHHEDFT